MYFNTLKKYLSIKVEEGDTNNCVKIWVYTEKLYLLILQFSRTFYFDDPNKKTDPFRMGFVCNFLTWFSFVIKAFVPPLSPLSGMPNSNLSPILELQPLGHLVASFSIRLPGSQWRFVLHIIPACAPRASPTSFILSSHVETKSYTKLGISDSWFW